VNDTVDLGDQTRTLDELCALTQLPKRTIRYYIQIGLLERPIGETRAARYGEHHLRRLLQIHQLSRAGSVEQWTRLVLADGLELSINPDRASLSPPQIRALFREALAVYQRVTQEGGGGMDAD